MTVDAMSAPLAVFTCRPTSHPFQERQIAVSEPIKIGRSVARARPAPNNAIFDCKVLSRNHALLWYEDGKFFLQDTKSSNGTFVNNQRLSKGAEESLPREIFSGDIIQFGVDVMENSRRVTHGCIIATVTLYNADGSEAKPAFDSPSSTLSAQTANVLNSQEMYQLSQYLQEALQREQMLESKLGALQRLLDNTQKASESSWQALIDEDRLLSRLESLQSQLTSYAKAQTEGGLLEQLAAIHAEKANYECTAKETLRKVLEEKLEAVQKLADLERSLGNAMEECNSTRSLYDATRMELATLAETHDQNIAELQEARDKLKELQRIQDDDLQRHEEEVHSLKQRLDELLADRDALAARVDELAAARDTLGSMNEVNVQNAHLENKIPSNIESPSTDTIDSAVSQHTTVEEAGLAEQEKQQQLLQQTDKGEETASAHTPIADALSSGAPSSDTDTLRASEDRVVELVQSEAQLQKQLEQAQLQVVEYITKVAALEEKLRLTEGQVSYSIESACASLRLQLGEALALGDRSSSQAKSLDEQVKTISRERDTLEKRVEELAKELDNVRALHSSQSERVLEAQSTVESMRKEATAVQARLDVHLSENALLKDRLQAAETKLQEDDAKRQAEQSALASLRADCESLQAARTEWQASQHDLSAKLAASHDDCAAARAKLSSTEQEVQQLKEKCNMYSEEVAGLNATVDSMSQKLSVLASRSHIISLCSLGPLLLLVFAIGVALHPSLSWLTATVEPDEAAPN